MPDVSATDAARSFADLLDAVEHGGERFTIIRRGKPVARLEPLPGAGGATVKETLRRHAADAGWAADLAALRDLVEVEDRR